MPSTGQLVIDGWTVLDVNENPLTGMLSPADVTLTLQRQSGGAIIAAGEAVAWVEIGTTGRYYFSFTPLNSGRYILYLREIDPATLGRQSEFRWDITAAGTVPAPSFTNSFCGQSDVERWIGTFIDGTTRPNDVETATWAEMRAAVLTALCKRLGVTVTPASVANTNLGKLLREANAIGTALDYTIAQQFAYQPNNSDRIEYLQNRWIEFIGGDGESGSISNATGAIAEEINGSNVFATDHILSGDTLPALETHPTSVGIVITSRDVY
jgi:hypothetical protein